MDDGRSYQGEILPTPLCSMLACMSVKDGEESLAMDACEGHHDGVGVLHETSRAF